ncbi:hypothetical protein A3F66_04625 [candidate division TM6 bacterium RIFCSPHIGHO2_12_FULL_32_22]|nr:MAG: hypothetical protein A3F66_04625 [candidate division TM6 bacterium RIFCSPHIGHO2_12_FULL_32_22]
MLKDLFIISIWIISSIICIPIQEYTLEIDDSKKFSDVFYAFIRNLFIFAPLVLSFLFPHKYLTCLSITSVAILICALIGSTILEKVISIFTKKRAKDLPEFVYWFFIVLSTYTGFYIGKSENTCQRITDYSLYIIIGVLVLIIVFLILKKTNERKKHVELHQQYLNKDEVEYEKEDQWYN